MPRGPHVHRRGDGQPGVPPLIRWLAWGALFAGALWACQTSVGTREVDGGFVDSGGDASSEIGTSDAFTYACVVLTNEGCAPEREQCAPSAEGGSRCVAAGAGEQGAPCVGQGECAVGHLCGGDAAGRQCLALCSLAEGTCEVGACRFAFDSNGARVGWCVEAAAR